MNKLMSLLNETDAQPLDRDSGEYQILRKLTKSVMMNDVQCIFDFFTHTKIKDALLNYSNGGNIIQTDSNDPDLNYIKGIVYGMKIQWDFANYIYKTIEAEEEK